MPCQPPHPLLTAMHLICARFRATEQSLRQESGVPPDMALTSSLTQEGGLVDNLLHFLADEGPSGLLEGYVKLGTWVDNTLDLYKVLLRPHHALSGQSGGLICKLLTSMSWRQGPLVVFRSPGSGLGVIAFRPRLLMSKLAPRCWMQKGEPLRMFSTPHGTVRAGASAVSCLHSLLPGPGGLAGGCWGGPEVHDRE